MVGFGVIAFFFLSSMYSAVDLARLLTNIYGGLTETGLILLCVALAVGIITGILFCCYQKVAIMIGTAFLGASLALFSLFQSLFDVPLNDASSVDIVQQVLIYVLAVCCAPCYSICTTVSYYCNSCGLCVV